MLDFDDNFSSPLSSEKKARNFASGKLIIGIESVSAEVYYPRATIRFNGVSKSMKIGKMDNLIFDIPQYYGASDLIISAERCFCFNVAVLGQCTYSLHQITHLKPLEHSQLPFPTNSLFNVDFWNSRGFIDLYAPAKDSCLVSSQPSPLTLLVHARYIPTKDCYALPIEMEIPSFLRRLWARNGNNYVSNSVPVPVRTFEFHHMVSNCFDVKILNEYTLYLSRMEVC